MENQRVKISDVESALSASSRSSRSLSLQWVKCVFCPGAGSKAQVFRLILQLDVKTKVDTLAQEAHPLIPVYVQGLCHVI